MMDNDRVSGNRPTQRFHRAGGGHVVKQTKAQASSTAGDVKHVHVPGKDSAGTRAVASQVPVALPEPTQKTSKQEQVKLGMQFSLKLKQDPTPKEISARVEAKMKANEQGGLQNHPAMQSALAKKVLESMNKDSGKLDKESSKGAVDTIALFLEVEERLRSSQIQAMKTNQKFMEALNKLRTASVQKQIESVFKQMAAAEKAKTMGKVSKILNGVGLAGSIVGAVVGAVTVVVGVAICVAAGWTGVGAVIGAFVIAAGVASTAASVIGGVHAAMGLEIFEGKSLRGMMLEGMIRKANPDDTDQEIQEKLAKVELGLGISIGVVCGGLGLAALGCSLGAMVISFGSSIAASVTQTASSVTQVAAIIAKAIADSIALSVKMAGEAIIRKMQVIAKALELAAAFVMAAVKISDGVSQIEGGKRQKEVLEFKAQERVEGSEQKELRRKMEQLQKEIKSDRELLESLWALIVADLDTESQTMKGGFKGFS